MYSPLYLYMIIVRLACSHSSRKNFEYASQYAVLLSTGHFSSSPDLYWIVMHNQLWFGTRIVIVCNEMKDQL